MNLKSNMNNLFREWHYIPGGESMPIPECRAELKFVQCYLWGDMYHYLYKREFDSKLFMYYEWQGITQAREGCFVQYCYI